MPRNRKKSEKLEGHVKGLIATAAAVLIALLGAGSPASACSEGYYRSVDGSCVHRPYHTNHHVDGETAVCRDGTHSMSHHHAGTCSHHGGVDHWG
jgi:hypothetical protein